MQLIRNHNFVVSAHQVQVDEVPFLRAQVRLKNALSQLGHFELLLLQMMLLVSIKFVVRNELIMNQKLKGVLSILLYLLPAFFVSTFTSSVYLVKVERALDEPFQVLLSGHQLGANPIENQSDNPVLAL